MCHAGLTFVGLVVSLWLSCADFFKTPWGTNGRIQMDSIQMTTGKNAWVGLHYVAVVFHSCFVQVLRPWRCFNPFKSQIMNSEEAPYLLLLLRLIGRWLPSLQSHKVRKIRVRMSLCQTGRCANYTYIRETTMLI